MATSIRRASWRSSSAWSRDGRWKTASSPRCRAPSRPSSSEVRISAGWLVSPLPAASTSRWPAGQRQCTVSRPRAARSDAMTDGKGPLNGIRVIDLGRHQAGPRCAQVLARLGAEVIKIERLGGEETRYHAPWVRKQSAYWVQYNSGKKSLSMDLRKEDA